MYDIGFVDPSEDRHNIKGELGVATCGHMKLQAGSCRICKTVREKGFPDYQLIYIHRGQGTYLLDGRSRILPAGSAVLYRPGQPQIYSYRAADLAETYWIHFGGSRAAEVLQELGLTETVLTFRAPDHFISIMNRMIREAGGANPFCAPVCCGLLITLLCEAARISGKNYTENASIATACEMIRVNYNRKITNEQLAAGCGLSLSRFEHLFKEIHGCAPQQYKQREQILVAKELLLNTDRSIAEIADVVGFSDPLYFSRIFKQRTGFSPSAFRFNYS